MVAIQKLLVVVSAGVKLVSVRLDLNTCVMNPIQVAARLFTVMVKVVGEFDSNEKEGKMVT